MLNAGRWHVGMLILLSSLLSVSAASGQDPEFTATEDRLAPPAFGEDVAEPFVPLHPRTAEDRRRLEAVTDFATARALENQRKWVEAIARLKDALEKEPRSVPILRRLARLSFVMGRTEEAMALARRVLEVDPADTETLTLLISQFERKDDNAAAEKLYLELLTRPELAKKSPGYLLIQRSLGLLYADKLNRPKDAAAAIEIVMDALDDKAANQLPLTDQRRLLGMDEATAYGKFGEIFERAGRFDLAARAFQRGLVYDPEHPLLPQMLAESLLEQDRAADSLATLEPYLKRQPQGREPYELLIQTLTALKRQAEILPRLEAAARNDPRNLPLQYLLADRYREAGQAEKANELYRTLVATQPDPQGFGALAASLVREKKSKELIELLGKAFTKPETLEAVKPQIEAIGNNPSYTCELLDAALELQKEDPPKLSRESRLVLVYIATKAKQFEKLIPIQKLALERDPSPQGYREFWLDLYRGGKYAEASETLGQMLEKYPDQRDAPTLAALAQSRALAGDLEGSLTNSDEALKLAADDQEALRLKGYTLGRLGRNEEAIQHYQAMLERFPDQDEVVRLARSGLSIIYVNMEQFEKGEQELEILLERDPEDPGVNNDLGYLYADRGKNLEKAEAMIRKAVDEEPDNPSYLDSLGWVLYKRGKLDEALQPLERAAKDTTIDATIMDHLGDVYFKLNRLDDARATWRKAETMAASSKPPDKRLVEIRKKLESLGALDPATTSGSGASVQP